MVLLIICKCCLIQFVLVVYLIFFAVCDIISRVGEYTFCPGFDDKHNYDNIILSSVTILVVFGSAVQIPQLFTVAPACKEREQRR